VHRALGEQRQDCGANVAAPAAATPATAAAWATAKAGTPEPGAAEPAAEARSEAAEAWVERAVVAAVVLADGVAETASGRPPLFMDDTSVHGSESESEAAAWGCEWVAHVSVSPSRGTLNTFSIR